MPLCDKGWHGPLCSLEYAISDFNITGQNKIRESVSHPKLRETTFCIKFMKGYDRSLSM